MSASSGTLYIVSAPSGAGKTSLVKALIDSMPQVRVSVSHTTRAMRPGEVDGVNYHFVERERLLGMPEQDEFLEHAEVHENRYGTPREPVMAALEEGKDVLFDIDWQGAMQVFAAAANDVVRVFILPPSMAELSRRLHSRAQDAEDVIERRLGRAAGEIRMWGEYDYVLVNEDYDTAYSQLGHIYHAERLRRARNPWLRGFVGELLEE